MTPRVSELSSSRGAANPILLILIVVALFTLAIRWFAIFLEPSAFRDDPDSYARIATVWATTGVYGSTKKASTNIEPISHDISNEHSQGSGDTHHAVVYETNNTKNVVPTAFRPPLYPWFIKVTSIDRKQLLIKERLHILHVALGIVTTTSAALCFYIVFPSFSKSPYVRLIGSIVCGALVAIDPILLRQSQLIMTETLATALTMLILLLLFIRALDNGRYQLTNNILWSVSLGILFGLNTLCRPTSLAWLTLYILATMFWELVNNATSYRNRLTRPNFGVSPRSLNNIKLYSLRCNILFTALLVTTTSLSLLPWGMRNREQLGEWQWTTTHGGYTLLLANNHSLYDHFQLSWSRNWDESGFFKEWEKEINRTTTEVEADALANRLAKEVIVSRPLEFLASMPAKLSWLWMPWPNQGGTATRIIIGVWYAGLYCLAAIAIASIARKGRRMTYTLESWIPIICLVMSISLVHSVYWSNMRMRSVAMPAIAVLAVLGMCSLLDRSRPSAIKSRPSDS